jgi:GrpB-like predicted nucleotidyltransferase (UPF0157 family)
MTLRDPDDVAAYDKDLAKIWVDEPPALQTRIELCDYDPHWPRVFEQEAARVRSILGDRVVRLEHAGSTSVPGLPAKPIVDMVLEVPDSSDESTYLPDLAAAGYRLVIREPDWFEHRVLKGPGANINLHVFAAGSPEVHRMLRFRDWLRGNPDDRELYSVPNGSWPPSSGRS